MVNKQKGEKQSELDKIYADAKAKVTRETESAIAGGWGCLLLMLLMPFCVSPALVAAASRAAAYQQCPSAGSRLTCCGDVAAWGGGGVQLPVPSGVMCVGQLDLCSLADVVAVLCCALLCVTTVMEKESEGLLKSLDAQAEKISDQVLKRVLPEGVKV